MSAKHTFTLAARSASPFDSQVGTLTLLELVVAAVAERMPATRRRAGVSSGWSPAWAAPARSLMDNGGASTLSS